MKRMPRVVTLFVLGLLVFAFGKNGRAQDLQLVEGVAKQPLVAATKRLVQAMEAAGSPFSDDTLAALKKAYRSKSADDVSSAIQKALDPFCVAHVDINAESRVKVREGDCAKQLMENGWRAFLVKVHNQAEITPELKCESPNAAPVYQQGKWPRERPKTDEKLVDSDEVDDRFLTVSMLHRPPIKKRLSGLKLEYRILLLYSRDRGKREAALSFHVGAGTQDIGFRNALPVLFDCRPAVKVNLAVRDFDGSPTTAAFVIKDQQGRVYPHQSRRLAPDFFFHQQVYRADGEFVALPPGEYSVTVSRGPEYIPLDLEVTIPKADQHEVTVNLKRWIHLAKRNWFSGDHHIHAAGCSHYDSPTEGVGPEAMMRHVLGEDLNVGNVLSWGPCWYTQKQFFNGEVAKTQTLLANGEFQTFEMEIEIEDSSWVAARILPSAHTNPVFIHVAKAPIRANKKSAQWCIDSVAACWKSKKNQIHESERAAAEKAYQAATKVYEKIRAESK